MRRHLMWTVGIGIAVLVVIRYAGPVGATPSAGFTAATLARGTFEAFEVSNHSKLTGSGPTGGEDNRWSAHLETKGVSDVYVQSNVWAPGGTTGWHTHPGHSLIIVTAGTVTAYEGDDPGCRPHVYTAGMGFVDPGGDHVHVIRNEGTVEARTTAVQMIPLGAARRIDVAAPGNCPF